MQSISVNVCRMFAAVLLYWYILILERAIKNMKKALQGKKKQTKQLSYLKSLLPVKDLRHPCLKLSAV